MNFNLISPQGKGSIFNVRFNEPIIIPENASVHLNWAQFERKNIIKFNTEQSFTFLPKKVLPFFDFHNNGNGQVGGAWRVNGSDRSGTDFVFKVPAGEYTLETLQDTISNALFSTGQIIGSTPINVRSAMLTTTRESVNDFQNLCDNPSLVLGSANVVVPRNAVDEDFLSLGYIENFDNTNYDNIDFHHLHKNNVVFQGGGTPSYDKGLQFTANGDPYVANKPVATSWASYGMGKENFIHVGASFDQYDKGLANGAGRTVMDGGFDEFEYLNSITLEMNDHPSQQDGDVMLALMREGYSGVDISAGQDGSNMVYTTPVGGFAPIANRVEKTNIKTFDTGTDGFCPAVDFGVIITGNNRGVGNLSDHLFIVKAKYTKVANADGGAPDTTDVDDTQIKTITGMEVVYKVPLLSVYDPNQRATLKYKIGINTYFDRGNRNAQINNDMGKGTLHQRVFVWRPDGTRVVVYDTNTALPLGRSVGTAENVGYTKEFLEEFNVVANAGTYNLAEAKASIPFTPAVFSTSIQFAKCMYNKHFVKFEDFGPKRTIPNDSKPLSNSFLLDYTYQLTEDLAKLYSPKSLVLGEKLELEEVGGSFISFSGAVQYLRQIYGDMTQVQQVSNPFFYRNNDVLGQYRFDKFSIVLNNLPIKSYKNTDDPTRSGTRKPILANIPSPFAGADITSGKNGVIMGGYSASMGVVNRLNNQTTTTNNLDVQILNMEDDEPADQLSKSIINFTITANE